MPKVVFRHGVHITAFSNKVPCPDWETCSTTCHHTLNKTCQCCYTLYRILYCDLKCKCRLCLSTWVSIPALHDSTCIASYYQTRLISSHCSNTCQFYSSLHTCCPPWRKGMVKTHWCFFLCPTHTSCMDWIQKTTQQKISQNTLSNKVWTLNSPEHAQNGQSGKNVWLHMQVIHCASNHSRRWRDRSKVKQITKYLKILHCASPCQGLLWWLGETSRTNPPPQLIGLQPQDWQPAGKWQRPACWRLFHTWVQIMHSTNETK